MLILGRKLGQKIRIGHDITIHVLENSGKYVSVGIDAPVQVSIHREEIYNKIKCTDVPLVQKIIEIV